MNINPTDVFTLINFLAAGGSAVVVSFLFEDWKLAEAWDARAKVLFMFAICALISGAAIWAQGNIDKTTLDQINPYVQMLLALLPIFSNQLAHAYQKELKKKHGV